MARQRLGQHFLADAAWRKRIFETLPHDSGGVWVEIGAGHGEMTEWLASTARRVIAIETDLRLVERLRERAPAWPGVEVVAGDILTLDLAQLAGGPFRVYGNLPFYIASPILAHLFRFTGPILSIYVVVQFEVAARIVAPPGRRSYGYLSALCQFYAHPQTRLRIPPGAFRPPPKVTSALVEMKFPGERTSLDIAEEDRFLRFVQACFGQKRKTLRNNLRSFAPAADVEAALAACGLRSYVRAEQLSLAQFARVFRQLPARL